ncbi:MAG TPA: hypothetical protein VEB22_11485 [Phycisphaerales bacterium]|nr:hypothetical protein [Phycisphaerales bacterium]
MRAKASKSLRWWTVGFLVVVAVLIGLGFADGLVPAGWRQGMLTSTMLTTAYTGEDGRGVLVTMNFECVDEGRDVVVSTRATFRLLGETRVDDSLQPLQPPRTKAEADAHVVAQATPFALRHPGVAPRLPEGIAAPGQIIHVEYPERRWAASLMQVRSQLAINRRSAHVWLAGLAVWAAVLLLHWQEVLWPRVANACAACGYDQTGLPLGAICPECGTRRP